MFHPGTEIGFRVVMKFTVWYVPWFQGLRVSRIYFFFS